MDMAGLHPTAEQHCQLANKQDRKEGDCGRGGGVFVVDSGDNGNRAVVFAGEGEVLEFALGGEPMVSLEEGGGVIAPDEVVAFIVPQSQSLSADCCRGERHAGMAVGDVDGGGRGALSHCGGVHPVPERAHRGMDHVLCDAGADKRGSLIHARHVRVGVVDAHKDVGAVHALVGAPNAIRREQSEGQPADDRLHRHLAHKHPVRHVPHQQRRVCEAQVEGVLVVGSPSVRSKVRSGAAFGHGGYLLDRRHGLRVVGVTRACRVVVPVRVLRDPDLAPRVGALQAQVLRVADLGGGRLGVLHAPHPAVDLVGLAL
mmetsp:Transcript_45729/g.76208  ORF Transcript_45729/g.76208 Transcript_45729/m.76208 type:complete len:314 (-) Transcript_45729:186-1127(-)